VIRSRRRQHEKQAAEQTEVQKQRNPEQCLHDSPREKIPLIHHPTKERVGVNRSSRRRGFKRPLQRGRSINYE
jgi:hypothetical protein